jgi:hypothetical protein
MDVIDGLDLTKHQPRWILVETKMKDEVSEALTGYELMAQLSHHDYLYRLTG